MSATVPEPAPPPRDLARDDMRVQVLWYALVGAGALAADLVVFATLIALGVPVMAALVAGFAVGALTNYALSRWLAFGGGRYGQAQEVARLVLVALAGLALTAAMVAVLLRAGLPPLAAKLVATGVAFFWNYLGRRLFVFHAAMPDRTWRLSRRAVARVSGAVGGHDDG